MDSERILTFTIVREEKYEILNVCVCVSIYIYIYIYIIKTK